MRNLILLTFIFIGLFARAQQGVLIENTWYLQKIIIGESEYITPINEEVNEVPAYFSSNSFDTGVCNAFGGTIQYYGSAQNFILSDVSITLMDCDLSENFEYESLYFFQFFYDSSGLAQPFNYTIEEMNDYLILTVTNSVNIQAIYHTQNTVSIPDGNHLGYKFKVYPNPASKHVFIELPEHNDKAEIGILDIFGNRIAHLKAYDEQIQVLWDCSDVDSGVYFYQAEIGGVVYHGKLVIR